MKTIKEELDERVEYFKENDQLLEAQRISERTNFDIENVKRDRIFVLELRIIRDILRD